MTAIAVGCSVPSDTAGLDEIGWTVPLTALRHDGKGLGFWHHLGERD